MAEGITLTPEQTAGALLAIGGAVVAGVVVVILSQQQPPGAIGTALTIAASPTNPNVGDPVTVTGILTRADTSEGLSGQTVHLEVSTDLSTWSEVTATVTGSDGSYSITTAFQNPGTFYLRARFAGA